MKQQKIIGYASEFVSILLDDEKSDTIERIILFGSVARGDFDEESDVDIFIDTKEKDVKFIEERLRLFEQSDMSRLWALRGIRNKISLKIGELSKSPLKRSIISNGIILYGKYMEIPEKLKHCLLIKMNFKKNSREKNVSLWRKIYGYKQKINKKSYISKGIVENLGGKRIEKNIIIIPIEKRKQFLDFLHQNKIDYEISEMWGE